jgi:hypothetical protein
VHGDAPFFRRAIAHLSVRHCGSLTSAFRVAAPSASAAFVMAGTVSKRLLCNLAFANRSFVPPDLCDH